MSDLSIPMLKAIVHTRTLIYRVLDIDIAYIVSNEMLLNSLPLLVSLTCMISSTVYTILLKKLRLLMITLR